MNVSRQRRCYHGNFGGSTSYQVLSSPKALPHPPPIMAFQQIPLSSLTGSAGSSPPGTEALFTQENSGQFDNNNLNNGCLEMDESDGYVQGLNDIDKLQSAEEGPSYIGGRFRTFDVMSCPQTYQPSSTASWHHPVSEDMQLYSSQLQHNSRPMFVPPGTPQMLNNVMDGYSSSYENQMGLRMPPSVPYFNNPGQMASTPSGPYLTGPSSSSPFLQPHLNHPHTHFQSLVGGGELNDRLGYSSGSHLSIMASNLNPPDHMLHIYPSNSTNSTNGREARNRAEKNRRDKLNSAIQELSTMVPHVADSARRVDKTAILRLAAHGFRLNHVFKKTMVTETPNTVTTRSAITESFLQMMNGFLLTVTCRGQIVLVSTSLEQHLGHCQTDWYGQNILTYTHPDDHVFLKQQLVPTDLETLFDVQPVLDSAGEQRPRTKEEEDLIDHKLRQDRRDITIRLARAGPRSEPTVYEIVRLTGYFRRADLAPRGTKVTSFPGLHMIRRARTREESFLPLHTISGNDIVLVGVGLIVRPPKICDRLLEACKTEYKTRHLIDGRIVQCEQAISIVAGYMTDEVTGLSPFGFMHKDEVRWVIVALRQMYDYNKPFGESCYRLKSRTGNFIYLKTRGYLEIDKDTNKVHSFVCINTLVSEEEGKRMVSEMKRKFSIIIDPDATIAEGDSEDMSVENPVQIERAIMNLITNLESSGGPGSSGASSSGSSVSSGYPAILPSTSKSHESSESRSRPQLAIIAPQPSTIKPSVTKTMEVISGKKAAPISESESEDDDDSLVANNSPIDTTTAVVDRNSFRPSVVHRTTSNKSMNLDNSFTSSRASGNASADVRSSAVIVKPEQQDQNHISDGLVLDQGIDFNYFANDAVQVPGNGFSQYLCIKQEIMPGDLLHSPASSTVSSMSYEQPGGSSNSSAAIAASSISVRQTSAVVTLKRPESANADRVVEMGSSTKRRRRSSRSLDDIPDVGLSYETSSPALEMTDSTGTAELVNKPPVYIDTLESIGHQGDELRDQFLLMTPDNGSEGDNAMAEVSRSTAQLARIVEEQIEQREKVYSVRQDFGGRFINNNNNNGTSKNGGRVEYEEDEGEEQELFNDQEPQQETLLFCVDKSFDTNNLMPD